jgi:CRISPR/Cas system-associated endoribonuclease Cas2
VKNRFQSSPFKCNLHRYNAARAALESLRSRVRRVQSTQLRAVAAEAEAAVGLYKLNTVDR